MATITFVGNVTKDVELKTSSAGKSYCRFNIAVNSGYGDYKRTDYYTLIAFGKTAENICKFFGKGKQIIADCTPQQNKYQNKEGKNVSEVVFNVIDFKFPQGSISSTVEEKDDKPGDGFITVPDDMDDEMLPFS